MRFEEIFKNKYPKTAERILSIFCEANGTDATFETITKPALSAFVDTLMAKVATSSARTYCAQFKAVLSLYREECTNLAQGWERILSVKQDVSEQVYLTEEEVQRVISYMPDTPTEAAVQQQFILSCLVGARHGDIVNLTENNIRNGYICYVSQKTHMKAQVPLSAVAEKILKGTFRTRQAGILFDEDTEVMAYRRKVCDTTFNSTLRHICDMCDINEILTLYKRGENITAPKWKFVSSHTGRRTCATLLYLRGCDIYSISRILAHSSVEMTAQTYIMCPIRPLSEDTMAYFSQFNS